MEENELEIQLLGKGWGFPPTFSKAAKGVVMVWGEEDIRQSLQILLGTALTERFLHPEFGSNLDHFQFQAINTTTKTMMSDIVRMAIIRHEPRISLTRVFVNTTREYDGIILIELEYIIPAIQSSYNYVYPFYVTEQTVF